MRKINDASRARAQRRHKRKHPELHRPARARRPLRSNRHDDTDSTPVATAAPLQPQHQPAQLSRRSRQVISGDPVRRRQGSSAYPVTVSRVAPQPAVVAPVAPVVAEAPPVTVAPEPIVAEEPPTATATPDPAVESARTTPIEDMKFSGRVYNSLKRRGYNTAGELADAGAAKLREPQFGQKGIDEVAEKLALLGLSLAQDSPATT